MADRIDLDQMARELLFTTTAWRTAMRAAMSDVFHRAHDAGTDDFQQDKLLREENTRLKHKLADATSLIIRLRANRTPAQEKADG